MNHDGKHQDRAPLGQTLIAGILATLLGILVNQLVSTWQQSKQRQACRSVLLQALHHQLTDTSSSEYRNTPYRFPAIDRLLDGQTLDYERDRELIRAMLDYQKNEHDVEELQKGVEEARQEAGFTSNTVEAHTYRENHERLLGDKSAVIRSSNQLRSQLLKLVDESAHTH